jgi:hypothetical protein
MVPTQLYTLLAGGLVANVNEKRFIFVKKDAKWLIAAANRQRIKPRAVLTRLFYKQCFCVTVSMMMTLVNGTPLSHLARNPADPQIAETHPVLTHVAAQMGQSSNPFPSVAGSTKLAIGLSLRAPAHFTDQPAETLIVGRSQRILHQGSAQMGAPGLFNGNVRRNGIIQIVSGNLTMNSANNAHLTNVGPALLFLPWHAQMGRTFD